MPKKSDRTVKQTLKRYIEQHCAVTKGLEPATLKMHRYEARTCINPTIGNIKLRKLRTTHLNDLYAHLATRYVPSSVQKTHATVSGMLSWAERQGWVKSNVARLADRPRNRPATRIIPTTQVVEAFLEYAAARDPLMYDYARTMAATGIRPGEACGLMQADLDDAGILTVQRAVDVSHYTARIKGTKTNKVRRINVDECTADLIRSRPGEWVFGNDGPARTDLFSKRFRRLAAHAELKITPRTLRHFHATQLLGSGEVTLKDVADRLGHSTPMMTASVYVGSIPAHDVTAANVIANVLGALT